MINVLINTHISNQVLYFSNFYHTTYLYYIALSYQHQSWVKKLKERAVRLVCMYDSLI